MHELSIAISLVEMAAEEAARRGGVQVRAIHLKLGGFAGVVKEALLFSYEVACQGTALEGSCLVIEEVPVAVCCPACMSETTLTSMQRLCCAGCGALTSQIVRGRELEVVALEIEREIEAETEMGV